MAFINALLKGLMTAVALVAISVSAQVSFVEGIEPLEGVVIPEIKSVQSVVPGSAFKDCDECPEMIAIPAGNYTKAFWDYGSYKISKYQTVEVKSFAIGKFAITQDQWFAVMGKNPSSNKGRTLPVENVSWDDAQLFVQKLSQKTGKKYRLPSEAEWQYAATPEKTIANFLKDKKNLGDYAWYSVNSDNHSHQVGLKLPNIFGLYDMIGNVFQFVNDNQLINNNIVTVFGASWFSTLQYYSGDGYCYCIKWMDRKNYSSDIGLRVAKEQ